MLAEAMPADGSRSGGGVATLPSLRPVLVGRSEDIERLIGSERAGVTLLSLELRAALRDAEVAEQVDGRVDLDGARELLRTSLDQQLASRRHRLGDQLAQTRMAAAAVVIAAQAEARTLLATASAEVVQVLVQDAALGPVLSAPSLRVVADHSRSPGESADPTSPTAEGAVLATVTAAPPAGTLTPAPVAPFPVAPVAPVAPAPCVPAPVEAIVTHAPPDRSGLARYLYLDVVLPLIAVLIVVVVLLAWVG